MSSSTDSSDWNKSPRSRPQLHLPNYNSSDRTYPTSNGLDLSYIEPPQRPSSKSKSTTPRLGSFSVSNDTPSLNKPSQINDGPDEPGGVDEHDVVISDQAQVSASERRPDIDAIRQQAESAWAEAKMAVQNRMSNLETPTVTPRSARGGSRGGSRRGGRTRPGMEGTSSTRRRVKAEPVEDDTPLANIPPSRPINRGGRPRGSRAGVTSGRAINRGGRPRGRRAGMSSSSSRRNAKRKRRGGSDDEDDEGNSSGSEVVTLPQMSSSGRRLTQANNFSPQVVEIETPTTSTKKGRPMAHGSDAAPMFLTGAMKRKRARNPAEAAVCRNCGRGHSPEKNQVVFCDGCDTPWHQFCHDPPVPAHVIEVEEAQWHCEDCEIERSLAAAARGRVSAEVLARNTGMERTLKWKQDYLLSLPKPLLVKFLLKSLEEREDMPLFEPYPKPEMAVSGATDSSEASGADHNARRWSDNVEEPQHRTSAESKEKETQVPDPEEDDEGFYEDPLPYPKAGNGLPLPPEGDDLDILVDENHLTYSHSWKDAKTASYHGRLGQSEVPIEDVCRSEPVGSNVYADVAEWV